MLQLEVRKKGLSRQPVLCGKLVDKEPVKSSGIAGQVLVPYRAIDVAKQGFEK